jgi:hypothetical protein
LEIKLFLLLIIFTLSGCLSYTSYEDGKTIGKGKVEAMPTLNIHQSPSITFFENEKKLEDIPIIAYPIIAMSFKYGIGNKTDLYGKAGTNLGLNLGVKHQLIGERNSKFALAAGTEFGALAVISLLGSDDSSILTVQIPIYTSYHPSDRFTVFISPRYVYQFKSEDELNDYNYFGGNFGILYGRKNKIGLDLGIYDVKVKNLGRLPIYSIGVGGKFIF